MKIIKYVFLLLLLALVGISVYIATQNGEYTIKRSTFIKVPKEVVFNYINDYRNWDQWMDLEANPADVKFSFPDNTVGQGSSLSWKKSDGFGSIQSLFVKENDSIAQKMNYDGNTSEVNWKFKDTIGGTKVTWSTKGKMDFFFKIYSALNGGVDKVIGTMYERSLVNLDKNLDYEIKTFSIKEDGLVTKPQLFYVAQTFTTEISKINKNFKIVVPKITSFCADNDIAINGNPFIIYHSYDTNLGLAKISIALPIQSEIFLSTGSDINSGKIANFEAVKTTLTGDYSHVKKAYDKAIAVLNKKQLVRVPKYAFIAMYQKGKPEVRNPSKWITEIYIPLEPKVQPITEYVPAAQAPATPTTEEALPAKSTDPTKVIKKVEPKKTVAPKAIEEEFEF